MKFDPTLNNFHLAIAELKADNFSLLQMITDHVLLRMLLLLHSGRVALAAADWGSCRTYRR